MNRLLDFYQNLPGKIDPALFHIGSFSLRWYSLSYIFGFTTVYFLAKYRLKTERETYKEFTQQHVEDLLFYSILGAVLGGRLGYAFIYHWDYYKHNLLAIFSPWNENGQFVGISGISYHGGVIGIILIYFIFIHIKKIKGLKLMDLFAPCIPIGYTWGRLGNFMNGELYGRVTEHPIGMYFLDNSGRPFNELRHPSQLYEAFFEGLVSGAIIWLLRKKLTRPGVLSSLYLITYGGFRFLVEFFRQPDEQFRDEGETIGTVLSFMTMGQILCALMVIAGGIIFYYSQYHGKSQKTTL